MYSVPRSSPRSSSLAASRPLPVSMERAYLGLQRSWIHLGMCDSLVRDCSLCWCFPTRTDVQCFGIDCLVKALGDTGQFELEIVRCLISNLGALEEALKRPFLILSN